jgi:lysophospholipase
MNKRLISMHPEIALGSPTNRWLKEAIRAGRRARDAAAEIKVPVLLLQAGEDSVVRLKAQDEFCREAENCIERRLMGSRHEILMEKDTIRDQAIKYILDFLNRGVGARR